MDAPVVSAVLLAPFALGLLLRWRGVPLAALGLAVYAVVTAADGGGDAAELTGAVVLGAAGGFALAWAGALTRRLLRRR